MVKTTLNTRAILPDSLRYVRSDVPDKLTEQETEWMIQENIITIMDLRADGERKYADEQMCAIIAVIQEAKTNPIEMYRFADADVLITLGFVRCPACAGNLDMFRGFDYGALIYGGDDVTQEEWDNREWRNCEGIRYNLVLLCERLVREI